MEHTCQVCGATFHGSAGQIYCSVKCRYKAQAQNVTKIMREKRALKATRRCHDCGKPTPDYRCPKCLAKWRKKHGVSEDAVRLYGD